MNFAFAYDIGQLVPYINWVYFYHAWQVKPADEQQRLRDEAESFLQTLHGRYRAYALFSLEKAYSEGEDIVLERADGPDVLPFLRQQQMDSDCLCLADFVSPEHDQIGLFAASVDESMVSDYAADPYQHIMAQLLADRLAEAAVEVLHEQVRKKIWGYAPDEQLSIADMLQERFQGIRPAVGYPSLPDASLNFLLDKLLDFEQIGISLTESGAMRPHASVSGLMISHPKARYFTVGKIGKDQLCDYARRRNLPVETIKKFLSSNL